jgi:hypothetical protein
MRGWKDITFKFPKKLHAELKARLIYDEISLTKFVRTYIHAYLDKDPIILDFLKRFKETNKIQNKKKREKNEKLIQKGKKLEKTFNFTSKEIKDIYDILENESEVYEL